MLEKLDLSEFMVNPFKFFKFDNAICCVGNMNLHNGLTIGWGQFGVLWSKNVSSVYIKPTRYSFNIANNSEYFSIITFKKDIHKDIMKSFGTLSGKDVNKDELNNLHPYILDNCICYEEAELIITCKKIAQIPITKDNILDSVSYKRYYEVDNLIHTEYIGEIIGIYQNK